MCLRAVIMLHYVPAGLGDRLGAWPQSRSGGWRIWVLEAPGACRKAAWRSWPSSSHAGQGGSEGHGSSRSLARRTPSERRSAPALPSPSRSLPPLSPTCSFTHLTSSLPGRARARAQACSRARDSQGRPGRRGRAAALRAGPRRPRRSIYTLAGPGLSPSAPPCPAPARRPSGFFLLLLGPSFPQSPKPLHPVPTLITQIEGQPWAGKLTTPPTHPPPPHTHTLPSCRQTAHFQGAPGPTPVRSTRVRPSRAAKGRLQAPRRAPGRMRNYQNEPQVTSTSRDGGGESNCLPSAGGLKFPPCTCLSCLRLRKTISRPPLPLSPSRQSKESCRLFLGLPTGPGSRSEDFCWAADAYKPH